MNADLILEYSIGGGSPPASSELLRIDSDGAVTCIVGNAWPEGTPQDEAGLYRMRLLAIELAAMTDFLREHRWAEMSEAYSPRDPDSEFYFLRLPSGERDKTITWSPYAHVPDALAELSARLRQVLQRTRQYPDQVVAAALSAPERVSTGQPINIELRLHNRGGKPIPITMAHPAAPAPLRLYAATAEQAAEARSPVSFYRRAGSVLLAEQVDQAPTEIVELLPGQEQRRPAATPLILEKSGEYQVYGFVEVQVELTLEDGPLALACFLVTQPVTVVVEHRR